LTPDSHSTDGIRPGDIFQTEGVHAKWWPPYPPPPGHKWAKPFSYDAGHHSGIIANVNGNMLTLLEQTTVHGIARPKYTTLNLDGLHSGTISVYSPVPK
jgi:hypothetical protein